MEVNNNPAGRLHALLSEGQRKPKNKPASEIWAELLDVPKDDTGLLLQRVGCILSLPSNIKEAMSYIDNSENNIYLRWLPRVEVSFSILTFQLPWKQFIERFDGEIMYGIEICSDKLSKERPEKVVDEALLANLLDKVNALLLELDTITLDKSICLYIHNHLIQIKEAIEEYRIRGIKPLEAVFEQAIGSVSLAPEMYQEGKKTTSGTKFWEVMGHLAIVLAVTSSSIQIGKDIVSILPPPEIESNISGQEEIQLPKIDKLSEVIEI